jgi:hypothetical protein
MATQNFTPGPVTTSNNKQVWAGSFFAEGRHGKSIQVEQRVDLARTEGTFVAYVFLTMLSAEGGDFDEDDTIFADIYMIDGNRLDVQSSLQGVQLGGVWKGNHFGAKGDVANQTISAYTGPINDHIVFRIRVTGDNWVGASYVVMEL